MELFTENDAQTNVERTLNRLLWAWQQFVRDPNIRAELIDHYSDPKRLHHDVSMVMAMADDFMDGWLLHFNIVFFIEQAEQLVLVTYFRYFHGKYKLRRPHNS